MMTFFSRDMVELLCPGRSIVLVENVKYDPGNRKEQFEAYEKKVKGLGATLGKNGEEIPFNAAKDCFATFLVKENCVV